MGSYCIPIICYIIFYITDTINKCLELSIPLIIFSTYNSAERIESSRLFTNTNISIILNDEAHYLVQYLVHVRAQFLINYLC